MKNNKDHWHHAEKLKMSHRMVRALTLGTRLSLAAVTDFGLRTEEQYAALRYAVLEGGIRPEQLAAVAGSGPAVTALMKTVAGNPWRDVVFRTPWDDLPLEPDDFS
jgi:hypothetical protein